MAAREFGEQTVMDPLALLLRPPSGCTITGQPNQDPPLEGGNDQEGQASTFLLPKRLNQAKPEQLWDPCSSAEAEVLGSFTTDWLSQLPIPFAFLDPQFPKGNQILTMNHLTQKGTDTKYPNRWEMGEQCPYNWARAGSIRRERWSQCRLHSGLEK